MSVMKFLYRKQYKRLKAGVFSVSSFVNYFRKKYHIDVSHGPNWTSKGKVVERKC